MTCTTCGAVATPGATGCSRCFMPYAGTAGSIPPPGYRPGTPVAMPSYPSGSDAGEYLYGQPVENRPAEISRLVVAASLLVVGVGFVTLVVGEAGQQPLLVRLGLVLLIGPVVVLVVKGPAVKVTPFSMTKRHWGALVVVTLVMTWGALVAALTVPAGGCRCGRSPAAAPPVVHSQAGSALCPQLGHLDAAPIEEEISQRDAALAGYGPLPTTTKAIAAIRERDAALVAQVNVWGLSSSDMAAKHQYLAALAAYDASLGTPGASGAAGALQAEEVSLRQEFAAVPSGCSAS